LYAYTFFPIDNNLGSAYYSKDEHDKAIEYYEKSLKINLDTLGENHPNIKIIKNNIDRVKAN
jgi:tetratricopeptide (TPR) repeat protein